MPSGPLTKINLREWKSISSLRMAMPCGPDHLGLDVVHRKTRSRPGVLFNGVDWTYPTGSYRSCLPGHATIWIVHRSSHRFELVRYAYGIVK
jgi:hypothetical protein